MYFLIKLDLKICLFSDILLPQTPKNYKSHLDVEVWKQDLKKTQELLNGNKTKSNAGGCVFLLVNSPWKNVFFFSPVFWFNMLR